MGGRKKYPVASVCTHGRRGNVGVGRRRGGTYKICRQILYLYNFYDLFLFFSFVCSSIDALRWSCYHGLMRLSLYYRYSPFLMACYNPDTEEFQSVCRVMSGFSDSFYTEVNVDVACAHSRLL